MARDIASVADKDTRDDFETRGEPVLPQPDGPRSEGGPAAPRQESPEARDEGAIAPEPDTTEPAFTAPASEAQSRDAGSPIADPTHCDATAREPAAAPPEAPAAEHTTRPPVEPVAETLPLTEPTHPNVDSSVSGPPAPVEPRDSFLRNRVPFTPRETTDLTPSSPDHGWSSAIADAISPTPTAAEDAPPALEEQPSPVVTTPDPAAEGNAFTDAAEGLFRPGHADPTTEETHLITLGRRLNPTLLIPKPVAPVIEPAARTETRIDPAPAFEEKVSWADGTWTDRLRIAARYAAYAMGGYLALVLALILVFRFVNPPGSMLMLGQLLTGTSIDRRWVPIGSISPNLIRAVIVSEDGRFCEHSGIDTEAIREAIERANRGAPRGASTISMQVTKNLFLWNAKSYVRKVIEIPLTLIMELIWPKQRVLEVYLNIAEWGPGIFGAEAAAQHHFGTRAANLDARQAALLAAVLPNPVARNAGAPNGQTSAKARVIQSRVKAYGAVASCVVSASAPAAAPAAVTPGAKAVRPLRKPQQRPAARPKPGSEWTPSLQFGPN